jgi:hypothetical protein
MHPRTFPGPWQVEASDGAFFVRDAKGFPVTLCLLEAAASNAGSLLQSGGSIGGGGTNIQAARAALGAEPV